jgi:DNA-binding NarL/FixJ family response regulator
MRIVLVGPPVDRARLRAQLPAGVEVVAEVRTMADARAIDLDSDAFVLASEETIDLLEIGDQELAAQESLTPREMQVLDLLAEGLPNKAIATRLAISDQTVKFHVSAICGKLGAANRTDAVRRAVRRGLISL